MSKEMITANSAQTEPTLLIQAAIDKGADLDKLEKLLEIQIRWEKNEAVKAFNKAMAEFKAEPIKIDKDHQVKFNTKDGGPVSYKHATLANVVEKISGVLSKFGLSASWRTKQNGKIEVTCRITHEKGHYEETTLSADADNSGKKNSIQAIGSTITYLQRYTLLAMTGLATYESDDDGISAIVEPSVEPISDEQANILYDLLSEIDEKEDKLCDHFNIDSLQKLPRVQFPKAKAAIAARKNQKKAQAKESDPS